MKKYNSFKEIDKDLKIFKLETQISKQKANIDLVYIKRAFSFTNIVAELFSYFGQKAIYARIGTQILRKFGL
ncbi:hypothetical protein ES731_12785 [Psychroflexus gondwanensis]|jgi:hypothetical protein|uniref:Uncharacterized protein n=1 Tax=Psychroflexus gondwanensis ACAM 44 TaxID=1189619 RepID=N1WR03_9FLAO|nr:DUF6327 family protein [Psychroflexus gondwanensis]EMY82716.1 hypothetical protein pgond44_01300 [Psychroflexus gondwanensis ACAM 44]TXE16999.1 hypothetical protein ES731_12785 [Psychroflexus gondwanensis]